MSVKGTSPDREEMTVPVVRSWQEEYGHLVAR